MIRSVLIFILLMLAVQCFAQRKFEPSRFYYRPSLGGFLPASSHPFRNVTDHLIEYGSGKPYLQFFSMGYFFGNFGLETSISGIALEEGGINEKAFVEKIKDRYGERYHTTVTTGTMYEYIDSEAPIVRGSIGPTYKIERNRWILVCRAMVGAASVATTGAIARLKEKGTNELIHANWKTENATKEFFSVNPSLTFGYRLGKRLIVDIDIGSWFYKTNINYSETITSESSGDIIVSQYRHNHFASEVSLGVGLMMIFK